MPIGRELVLDDLPKLRIKDGLVLAGDRDALVSDLATINPVLQHQIECAAGKSFAPGQPSAGSFAALTQYILSVEFGCEQRDRSQFRITLEDQADGRRLGLVDDQLPVLDVITKWHIPAHPHALTLRRRDLVADALAGDFPLELGEGQQHVQRQTPHGSRRIELLRYRHEGRIVGVEDVDDLGEIRQ